jgi:TPR repeat protein
MRGFHSIKYILGQMYFYGIGVKKDYQKAAEYFKYAFPYIQFKTDDLFMLGTFYYFGLYKDLPEYRYIDAYKAYKKAAEENHPHATYMLGIIYYYGKNKEIGKNEKKALECFKSAYEKGDDDNKLLFFNIK